MDIELDADKELLIPITTILLAVHYLGHTSGTICFSFIYGHPSGYLTRVPMPCMISVSEPKLAPPRFLNYPNIFFQMKQLGSTSNWKPTHCMVSDTPANFSESNPQKVPAKVSGVPANY